MAKAKAKRKIVLPEPMWKNTYPEQSDEYEKAWLVLENASIDVIEDLGFKSFGGPKIDALRDAVWKLRVERAKDECRTLMRIAEESDRTPEAEAFAKKIILEAQRIIKAEEAREELVKVK